MFKRTSSISKPYRFTLLAMLMFALVPGLAFADKYQDAVKVFRNANQTSEIFDDAYAYVVFPSIGKGGLGVGAAYGKGKAFIDDAFVGDVTMSQLTIGFQMGGQAYSQIIFFKDEHAFEAFTAGNFEFGAQATAVAINLGASAETSTKGSSITLNAGDDAQSVSSYYKGMAVFTIAKGGLMYEASIGGQKFEYRSAESLPGYIDITIEDLKTTKS